MKPSKSGIVFTNANGLGLLFLRRGMGNIGLNCTASFLWVSSISPDKTTLPYLAIASAKSESFLVS